MFAEIDGRANLAPTGLGTFHFGFVYYKHSAPTELEIGRGQFGYQCLLPISLNRTLLVSATCTIDGVI
jgi:hypothetical protein